MLRPYHHALGKFGEAQRSPPRASERGHLPRKHRSAHPSHAELEWAADPVIAENWDRQWGHIHVKTAHVTSAKMTPSSVDLSVIVHARRYQIDIWNSASV